MLSRKSAWAKWQFYRHEVTLYSGGDFPHLSIFLGVDLSSNIIAKFPCCASNLSRERVSLGNLCFHVAQQKLDGNALLHAGIKRNRRVAE